LHEQEQSQNTPKTYVVGEPCARNTSLIQQYYPLIIASLPISSTTLSIIIVIPTIHVIHVAKVVHLTINVYAPLDFVAIHG
jgi:hypothetical protein